MRDRKVRVISYSGYLGEESPRTLMIDGRIITVAGILARSVSEERDSGRRQRCFTLRGSDGETYRLHHDEALGEWVLDE